VSTVASILFICTVGLCVGTSVTLADLSRCGQPDQPLSKRWAPMVVGTVSQFIFMPFAAWAMTHILTLDEVAEKSPSALIFGATLVGCMPGGSTSNLFAWAVNGNISLSILLSLASNIFAVGLIPFNLWLYYQMRFDGAESADVPHLEITITLFIICLGVVVGMAVRHRSEKAALITGKIAAGFAVLFLLIGLIVGLINYDGWGFGYQIWLFAGLMQPLGYGAGLLISWVCGMDWTNMMTISIETGVQNFALAMAIVTLSYDEDDEEFDDAFVIPALCAALYAIHCVWIVLLFRYVGPVEAVRPVEAVTEDQSAESAVETELDAKEDSPQSAVSNEQETDQTNELNKLEPVSTNWVASIEPVTNKTETKPIPPQL